MSESPMPYRTIVEALLKLEGCTAHGARFISRSGEAVFHSYKEILEKAKMAAGVLQAKGLEPGDRVSIILTTSEDFLFTFLGVQLAGGIPVALYPPVRLGRLPEYCRRTQGMLTRIGARFLITEPRLKRLLGRVAEGVDCLDHCFLSLELQADVRWEPVEVNPESPALLQFSSGTTSEPRAVIITHLNLLHNLEMMNSLFRGFPEVPREGVCWLPLYHDMGLIGCMFNGLYHPATVTYVSPEHFIVRPALWLQTISLYRAPISPAPQFAYSLCVNKIRDDEMDGVDLSCWIAALNGAEPLDVKGMERFVERFSRWGFRRTAMTPVYGMAEAGLAISFSDIRKPPVVTEFDVKSLSEMGQARPGPGQRLASLGRPFEGLEVRIRGEGTDFAEPGTVGEIMVRGPSITPGYFNDPESTAAAIHEGWLHTGDIGFFHEGEIYIVGREKDVIIIHGRNIAPQEIELLLHGLPGLRAGCVVALGAVFEGQGEKLIVLAEKDPRVPRPEKELISEIQGRVLAGISVAPGHVQILDPGTLPRTSSGKMRRGDAGRMFFSGKLVPPEKMGVMRLLVEAGRSQWAWARFRLKRRA